MKRVKQIRLPRLRGFPGWSRRASPVRRVEVTPQVERAARSRRCRGAGRQISLAKRLGVPQALGLSIEEWVNDRLGGYVRMSIEDRREAVRNLTAEDYSTREIADIVGVSHVTVADDVKNLTPIDAVAALAADGKIRREISRAAQGRRAESGA
jgi:hypothetical protein